MPKPQGLEDSHVLAPSLCIRFFRKTFYTWPSGRALSPATPVPPKLPTWRSASPVCFLICLLYGTIPLPSCWVGCIFSLVAVLRLCLGWCPMRGGQVDSGLAVSKAGFESLLFLMLALGLTQLT